jgi:hypothetical protein
VGAVLGPVTRDRTDAATRAALKKVWDLTVSAQKDFGFAFADLAGANIAPRGQPRQFYANRAIARVDTVQNSGRSGRRGRCGTTTASPFTPPNKYAGAKRA